MPRPRSSTSGKLRPTVSIRMDPDQLAWLRARVGPTKQFASVSHAIARAVALLQQHDEKR